MSRYLNERALVIGLGVSGRAASELLAREGAHVVAIDGADSPSLRRDAEALRGLGVEVRLGFQGPPPDASLVVLSPGVPTDAPMVASLRGSGVPVIGELELGYRHSRCLHVGITGTNGKTTTTELVDRVLRAGHRRCVAAGNIGIPLCAVVGQTPELDFVVLEVSSFQLETIEHFRPAVAVLTNLTPDHLDRYASMEAYVRAKARMFLNQQPYDWAIVQHEALVQLKALGLEIPSKVISYSAENREADLHADRGLLVSRLPDWSGPLMDMAAGRLRGPHNAENLLAALAVGHVLRVPLEVMVEALTSYAPAPHRCEWVAESGGVEFVNDSKATNVDAVAKAILSMRVGAGGEPNIHLIAGGVDKGFEFHDLGPLLARRVKRAYLLGETREKLRAAWSLFTPCTAVGSLLEAVQQSVAEAAPGDVVLLSPACSSFDMFRNYQHRGEVFREAVQSVLARGPHGGVGLPTAGA